MGKIALKWSLRLKNRQRVSNTAAQRLWGCTAGFGTPSEPLPSWHLQGRIQPGVPGDPEGPRCSHAAGTSHGAPCRRWSVEGDVFSSPAALCLQNAPSPLAAHATCPCASHQGHRWARASPCPWLGGCKNFKLGGFSLNLSLPSKSVQPCRAGFGVPLWQRLPFWHGCTVMAPTALAPGRWFAAETRVFPGWGAAPAGAAGGVGSSPVPPTCLPVCRAGHGTLFSRRF